MKFSESEKEKVIRDYELLSINDYEEKYKIQNYLHTWTIEHYRGINLPYDYSLEEAFDDYNKYCEEPDYPSEIMPWQLYDEVITLIIEADSGNPF